MTDYIQYCKYYKGEENNPFQDKNKVFWEIEQIWVNEMLKSEESDVLYSNTSDYIQAGLLSWNENDVTPYLLKVLLFSRYRHWLGGYGLEQDAEAFKQWYQNEYMTSSF